MPDDARERAEGEGDGDGSAADLLSIALLVFFVSLVVIVAALLALPTILG